MKYLQKIIATSALFAMTPLFADMYDDFAAYDYGKDNAWFFSMLAESQSKVTSPQVQARIVKILETKEVSDAAFRTACEILKPIATDDCIRVIQKALENPARVSSACNVLMGLGEGGEDALIEMLDKVACNKTIISTIASFNNSDAVDAIAKYAVCADPKLAEFATVALGTINDPYVLDILEKNVKSDNPEIKKAAEEALVSFAVLRYAAGNKPDAYDALELLPKDSGSAVALRAKFARKNINKYLDSLIIKGGKLAAPAGRAMNGRREFAESAEIIAAFPKLSKESKLAAMGTFMLSGDTRFYPTIAPELNSPDTDLRAEAIYSARFLCTDDANLRKIWEIFKSGKYPFSGVAENVFAENPSLKVDAILNEKAKNDLSALEILVYRGDLDARNRLWQMFANVPQKSFEPNAPEPKRDSKIVSAVEKSITYGDLREFAKFMKSDDKTLVADASKVIIKKLAKSRDKSFIKKALPQIMKGYVDFKSPEYKFMEIKLGLVKAPAKPQAKADDKANSASKTQANKAKSTK